MSKKREKTTKIERPLLDWNDQPIAVSAPSQVSENPCVRLYGLGPEGVTCKFCVHLDRDRYHNITYRKCDLRTLTRGAGTDHKAGWPACKRYEDTFKTSENHPV